LQLKPTDRGACNTPTGLTKSTERVMPTATINHTTPTRRSALGFSVAAIFAGLTVPALAIPPMRQDQDAQLVAIGREAATLVDEFSRCSAAFFALPDGDPTLNQVADAGDPSFFRLAACRS
jgi:hypothetical protein